MFAPLLEKLRRHEDLTSEEAARATATRSPRTSPAC
jgi:hypothetical protein